jgi:Uma2 family endonuclease
MAVADEVRSIVALLMTKPITETVLLEVKTTPGFRHLLVTDGIWSGLDQKDHEVTTGESPGWLEFALLYFLGNFIIPRKLGRLYPGDITFVLDGEPNDIRISREPDISFVKAAHVTPSDGFIYRAPDIAIEIISPSQSYEFMVEKANLYCQYGTQQVWIVFPKTRQIEVRTSDGDVARYGVGDQIDGGALLPGLILDVRAVFEL